MGCRIRKVARSVVATQRHVSTYFYTKVAIHPQITLFVIGAVMLSLGLEKFAHAAGESFDDTELKYAVCQNFKLIEGPFGALLMTVAGIGAIVSAVIGQYKAAYQALTVGVGAFVLRSLVSLWFGDDFYDCSFGGGLFRDDSGAI